MNRYFLPKNKSFSVHLPTSASTPYFSVLDENKTVKLFVEALSKNKQDEAKAYIAKNFVKDFDLPELSVYFGEYDSYKHLVKVEFQSRPKNCKTNSILVLEGNKSSIIHLHMVKEPDQHGSWKIYGIEKE